MLVLYMHIKITQYFKLLGILNTAIFTRANRDVTHNKRCGPM